MPPHAPAQNSVNTAGGPGQPAHPGGPAPLHYRTSESRWWGGQAQCTVVQHLAGNGGVTGMTLPSCGVAKWPLLVGDQQPGQLP